MISAWMFVTFAIIRMATMGQDPPLDFSCATFHAFLSHSELVSKFGSENITGGPVFGSDDGPEEGTILFPDAPDSRVEILWRDGTARQNPAWIRVRGERSRWHTPNGLTIGQDLATIEKRNGRPFRLAGFTSERHGQFIDWGIGRLGITPYCNVGATFQPQSSNAESSLLRQVTSLAQVSSGHPAMQKINPEVVELWIRYPEPGKVASNPNDALLDVLVFGMHVPIDPAQYSGELRTELQQYLRQASAYIPRRPILSSAEMEMVHSAQVTYETRLAAISNDPEAPSLAQAYVDRLNPCYEWEGYHDCPERDAQFADEYQAAHPNGPFRNYLPLLAAHRWLCAAEGYDYERNAQGAERSRRLYHDRIAVARQSAVLLIRTAAERLAERGRCLGQN